MKMGRLLFCPFRNTVKANNKLSSKHIHLIGPLHNPVTWYKIIDDGEVGLRKKRQVQGLVRVALFWKSHCATCSPACAILYHVTGSCKGPIQS